MLQVFVYVKPEYREAFFDASPENDRASRQKAGVARFGFYARQDDPARFVLIEVYRDAEAPAKHKETSHHKKDTAQVEEMLAEPRQRNLLNNGFPGDEGF